jgi:putative protease
MDLSLQAARRPELLAPAGDMICLQAALDAGANAVYLGLERLNMRRAAARNFSLAELAEAAARCRSRGARLYLTLNSIVYEDELPELEPLLASARPHLDAVIVADWAVIDVCRKLGIPFHVSTQMSVSNSTAARALQALGAKRIVLARECTLDEIRRIAAAVDIELEAFVHGAMCVAVSGRCLLSHEAYGFSGSRGECRQPCRRRYEVREIDGEGATFHVGEGFVLSPRDLCSLPFLDDLLGAGLTAFKIEGRTRSPEFVHTVVSAYRRGLDAAAAGVLTSALKDELVNQCRRVYNREFSKGLYFGRPGTGDFTTGENSAATCRKFYVGLVRNYYKNAHAVDVEVQDESFGIGDTLSIQGPTTGVVNLTATELRRDAEMPIRAERGTWVTLPCPDRVRLHDRVYVIRETQGV